MDTLVSTPIYPHHSAAVRRLGANLLLSRKEVDYLEELQVNRIEIESGKEFLISGEVIRTAMVVRKGWAMRWHVTGSGRRQIINLYLPGDFIGLRANFNRVVVYSVSALTPMEAALVEPARILDVYREYPVLASGLDWSSVRSFNILSERNISLGSRNAASRIGHFLLELWFRLAMVGLTDKDSFEMPLTQEQLSEVLGLSLVHTNRTLSKLTREGLIDWQRGRVQFPDFSALVEFSEFDDRYLDHFNLREVFNE